MPNNALILVALALFSEGIGNAGPNESLSGKPLLLLLEEDWGVVFGLSDGVGGLLATIPWDAEARNAASSVAAETLLSPYSRAMAFQNEVRWLE